MRKIFAVVFIFALFLSFAPAAKAGVNDFTIQSFTGDYYLSRDASRVSQLAVHEKILATFPVFDQNHGILRAIPETYQHHPLEIDVQKVSDEHGNSLPYSTSHSNGNTVLKIGATTTYVHGTNSYAIDYTMRGVTQRQTDHDEFYWDINGDQWSQSFGQVTARVHIPADMTSALQDRKACYIGAFGSSASGNCTISVGPDQNGGTLVGFGSTNGQPLEPRQTMSVVLAFNQSTFADYTPSMNQLMQWVGTVAMVVLPPLFTLIFMIRKWRKNGRDPRGKGVIVPQYVPPKEVSVLGSSAVLREKFVPRAISATVIDFAVRHYIKIYETKPKNMFHGASYELELVKVPDDLRQEEKEVVSMLFAVAEVGARVSLNSLKTTLAVKIEKLGKKVNNRLASDGYFRVPPERAKLPYYTTGGLMVAAGSLLLTLGLVLFISIGMILAGIILLIGANFMPARTQKGVELRDYLLGLRDYMKLAEEERLKVLQSPHGELTEKIDAGDKKQLVKLYERLLPYAMMFALEKEWAKELAGLYDDAPYWYSGNGAFSAVWFASSLNGFTASAATTFAPPSSSSSSGFGGGFAGGGGGGGGGGGW